MSADNVWITAFKNIVTVQYPSQLLLKSILNRLWRWILALLNHFLTVSAVNALTCWTVMIFSSYHKAGIFLQHYWQKHCVSWLYILTIYFYFIFWLYTFTLYLHFYIHFVLWLYSFNRLPIHPLITIRAAPSPCSGSKKASRHILSGEKPENTAGGALSYCLSPGLLFI